MKKTTILVTGGSGYLGSKLVSELLKNPNNHVIVYDNLMYNQMNLMQECGNPNFQFVYGDVRDEHELMEYVQQADVIYPLAGIVGFPACDKDGELATSVNFDHVEFILSQMEDDQRIIYPNTNSGYGLGEGDTECTEDMTLKPITHYGITKCWAEDAVLDSGRGIVLRLATVFGVSPRMRTDLLVNDFVHRSLADGYLVLFEKDSVRNYVHISDVIRIFIKLAEPKIYEKFNGEIFNIGLPDRNYTKMELAQTIKEYVPKLSINVDDFTSDPDQRDYIVSNVKIKNTGFAPTITIEEGVEELISAYTIMLNCNREFTNV